MCLQRAMLGGLVTAFLFGLAAAGCEAEGPPEQGSPFDEDLPPEVLSDLEAKEDSGAACADHPGGALSGDDLLVVVNKEEPRQLRSDWSPPDLVPISPDSMMPGREGLARVAAVLAFYRLAEAAAAEAGLDLVVRSAYRSFTTQCYTFNYKVETSGYEHAARFSARPGRSEHQLGTALDITSARIGYGLTQAMGDSPEGIWLAENADRFGFGLSYPYGEEQATGYGYEPWHWRYIGREAAAEMRSEGLMLLDYLLACDGGTNELVCPREEPPEIRPNEGFIGGACEYDDECASLGSDATCLGAPYVEGHCTVPCERYCPDRPGLNAETFCVADYPEAETGLCHSKCDFDLFPDGGCRDGYECGEASRPNAAGIGRVCLPPAS